MTKNVAAGTGLETPTVLVLHQGDKLLLGGTADNEDNFSDDAALVRFNADGTLDTTFGDMGVAFADFSFANEFFNSRDLLLDIAIQPNDELTLYRFTGEPAPGRFEFAMPDIRVDENAGSVEIPIRRRSGGSGIVTVEFLTDVGGTATADVDYTTTVETVTFNDNESFKSVTVAILKNAPFEGPETVNLRLRDPTGGASLGADDTAVLTIFDGPGSFQFTLPQFAANENAPNAPIIIERIDGSDGAATAR